MLEIPVTKLDDDLALPSYAKDGDAGMDLYARESAIISPAGGRAVVPTGIAVAIPNGYAGFVQPRSGLAAKQGISIPNAPGLIDSGYRDEIKVILINTDPKDEFKISRGDRIAQLVVQQVEEVQWNSVDELPESERGKGGFGHTGN
jgi:dUTP pyrophosphatase